MANAAPEAPSFSIGDAFQPTRARITMAVLLAFIAFWVPQEVPLEYYPLNNPSSGLQYLEITCAAHAKWTAEVDLDHGQGFAPLENIKWPMAASTQPYTYTFPLADAPLFRIRLNQPLSDSARSIITNLRIINRRAEEVCAFLRKPGETSDEISPRKFTPPEWRWDNHPMDGRIHLHFSRPLVAEGMNERNLKRCLLSVGYLTGMLLIVLLAVYTTFLPARTLSEFVASVSFLILLALCFSLVGNRGLVRNSFRYARIAADAARFDYNPVSGTMADADPVARSTSTIIRQGEALNGLITSGWFGREGNHRWIGKSAGLDFVSGPAGKVVISGFVPASSAPNEIVLSLEGVSLGRFPVETGEFTVTCPVPALSLVRLQIEVAKTIVPKDNGSSNDARELGVVLSDVLSE
jgi:hypothetical protein